LERFNAKIGEANIIANEIAQLFDPLSLDIFFRSNHEKPKPRIKVTKKSKCAESNVSLPKPDFVGEVRDALVFQNIVDCHGPLQLRRRWHTDDDRRSDQIVVGSREKPNHPPIIDAATFDLVQRKIAANRHKTSSRLYMATGLLKCAVCSAPMNAKYSKSGSVHSVVKYACSKKPNCASRRMLISDTNDLLWGALVELFVAPERIDSLITPAKESDLGKMKQELAAIEREEKLTKEKIDRLLNLYLEGNLPQGSYVLKSSELDSEAERLMQTKTDVQRRIQNHGKQDASAELIQTFRLLARSHRRFTEEQRVRVFRSLIRETRITGAGVEFEMYVQPTQNVWWKYRQKKTRKTAPHAQTVRVGIPQEGLPGPCVYTSGQVAKMLGISVDLLRLRIKMGKYPTPLRSTGNHRLFTSEQIQTLRAIT